MKLRSRTTLCLSLFFVSSTLVFSQRADYDIKAVFVKFSPKKITLKNSIVFTYKIENEGGLDIPAKSYDVEFYIDNKLLNFDYATGKLIAEKGNVIYSTENGAGYIPKIPGKHTYKLVVNTKKLLKEANIKNNIIEGTFIVSK